MLVSFQRGTELAREERQLPAPLYRQLRLVYRHCGEASLFVPIRSMQYLAVIDAEEVIFVDGMGDRHIELAWQNFQPQRCHHLDDPVPYECVFYEEQGRQTLRRLLGTELRQALTLVAQRHAGPSGGPAPVTPLPGRQRGPE